MASDTSAWPTLINRRPSCARQPVSLTSTAIQHTSRTSLSLIGGKRRGDPKRSRPVANSHSLNRRLRTEVVPVRSRIRSYGSPSSLRSQGAPSVDRKTFTGAERRQIDPRAPQLVRGYLGHIV